VLRTCDNSYDPVNSTQSTRAKRSDCLDQFPDADLKYPHGQRPVAGEIDGCGFWSVTWRVFAPGLSVFYVDPLEIGIW
jgi:hypothetical protein